MVSDPIADFLTRIRNAQQRKQENITLPSTKMLVSMAEILKKEGFIQDFTVTEMNPQNELTVTLKYVNNVPAIRELVRVSKPGIRKYLGYRDIKSVKKNLGLAIFSTPIGLVSGKQAIENKVGGEYICYVY